VIRTTALEQRMGTAGGWQDQAGGLTGGCKLLRTAPGLDQIPREVPVGVSEAFWREHVLVHSTGIQRLARNILQKVVWRWLGGGVRMRRIARELQAGAVEGHTALAAGEFDRFAATVGEYWRLKRELDPGSSTPEIDAMIESVSDLLSAWELPGAGGGGFLFMIARDGEAAQEIRRRFTARPPHARDAGGGFIGVAPAKRGLTVEVDGEN
jgi:galactokinase/mevalonate kinase-like predicted kinase